MLIRRGKHIATQSRLVIRGVSASCFFIVLLAVSPGCIEPYVSDIDEEVKILTIEGSLIKGDSLQVIKVHRTATLAYPKPSYVEGCEVKVVDDQNNEFLFEEMEDGEYTKAIPDEDLVHDREYKLQVITPDGNIFESEYENLYLNSAVDSVYYEIEERTKTYTDLDYWGLQYYVDIVSPDVNSRYYRWKLTETYEYTSTGFISYILMIIDDQLEKVVPDNKWEVFRCWVSKRVEGTYVTNTINLTINEKKKIPLNFVSNRSERLKIMYSLLVEQYAISEGAYKYWQQHNISISESNGLYTSQPGQPITNISCINDCDQRVLGFFWVASRTEKRIFTPRISNFTVYDYNCPIYPFDPRIHKTLPRYIRIEDAQDGDPNTGIQLTGHPVCFDCTLRGGSITKPDFWIY